MTLGNYFTQIISRFSFPSPPAILTSERMEAKRVAESIEGDGGGMVRVVVADGRTVFGAAIIDPGPMAELYARLENKGAGPGALIEVQRDECGRLIELGFAYLPGEPRVGGRLVDRTAPEVTA